MVACIQVKPAEGHTQCIDAFCYACIYIPCPVIIDPCILMARAILGDKGLSWILGGARSVRTDREYAYVHMHIHMHATYTHAGAYRPRVRLRLSSSSP